jgi:hypothetical protein
MVLRPENGMGPGWLKKEVEQLRVLAGRHNAEMVKRYLRERIPEYVQDDGTAVL